MIKRPLHIVRDGDPNRSWIESLRFSIDVFDARGNLVEVLGRLADLSPARAAFASAIQKYPAKLIHLRDGARVLGKSEEPPEWLAMYMPIPVFEEKPVTLPDGRKYRALAPDKRPQDRSLDGRGLKFEALEHGGEYPDTMPQAIRLTDPLGRSAIYEPVKIGGRTVERADDPE